MSTLLEVTIFRIDVLTLTVRVPPETGDRLRELTAGRSYSEGLADSVAAVVVATDDLWARQVFERDTGLDRMLDGMRETSQRAYEAGYIGRTHREAFVESLPTMFGFLEERGIREGDEIFFRIRHDTVRNLYRTADGEVLMDRSVVDPEARWGGVSAFFAPGTPFREGLVKSLISGPGAAGGPGGLGQEPRSLLSSKGYRDPVDRIVDVDGNRRRLNPCSTPGASVV